MERATRRCERIRLPPVSFPLGFQESQPLEREVTHVADLSAPSNGTQSKLNGKIPADHRITSFDRTLVGRLKWATMIQDIFVACDNESGHRLDLERGKQAWVDLPGSTGRIHITRCKLSFLQRSILESA